MYINKLRDKFACCNEFEIVTVHGLGYKAVLKMSAQRPRWQSWLLTLRRYVTFF